MAVPPLNVLSLCAGIGGIDLGIGLAVPSARSVCVVEREAAAAALLVRAMEKGWMDPAPVWDDLLTFRGRPWRGAVDLVAAGFPCQPWSLAGKRKGTSDPRWLWPKIAAIIRDVRPALVFLENVPPLLRGGLGFVLRDLSALGFDAEWQVVSAASVGAPHERARVYLLAHRPGVQLPGLQFSDLDGAGQGGEVAHGDGGGCGEFGRQEHDGRTDSSGDDVDRRGTGPVDDSDRAERAGRGPEPERGPATGRAPVADAGDGQLPGEGRGATGRGGAGQGGTGALADAERSGVHIAPPGRGNGSGTAPGGAGETMGDSARVGGSLREGEPGDDGGELPPADRTGGNGLADTEGRRSPAPQRKGQPGADGGLAGVADARSGGGNGVHVGEQVGHMEADAGRCRAREAALPLWPPGRTSDAEWAEVCAVSPAHAPAAATCLCGLADGAPGVLDQRRALGNSVCPLGVAYAFRVLAARLGLVGSEA